MTNYNDIQLKYNKNTIKYRKVQKFKRNKILTKPNDQIA